MFKMFPTEFPTNETELLVVFNVFDVKRLGRIQYKTFVDAIMRPDKSVSCNSCSSTVTLLAFRCD